MPFNPSTPIMYYNKTAFSEAGLDPENPPRTFAEIEEIGEKLIKKTAGASPNTLSPCSYTAGSLRTS